MTSVDFVKRRTTTVTLRDGTQVVLRPVVPEDKPLFLAGFERLSDESRYRRFMVGMHSLNEDLLRYLTEIDYKSHFAWGAIAGDTGVGVARYVRSNDEPHVAEAAVTVVDDYQGRGLGTILLEALTAAALENGVTRFRSYVLVDNYPMIEILKGMGAEVVVDSPGVYRGDIDLPTTAEKIKDTPLYRMLRAAARGEIGVVPRSVAGPA